MAQSVLKKHMSAYSEYPDYSLTILQSISAVKISFSESDKLYHGLITRLQHFFT